ncbi:protein MEI2-like 2 [Canna indica]|uniref:Protein MEI2-like 2 n=1 Tax=Canna indica TaxID=4628 RepID=A0AAQ3JS09_9LILI|nr:protein MEI2-like 2 [Canna indica]
MAANLDPNAPAYVPYYRLVAPLPPSDQFFSSNSQPCCYSVFSPYQSYSYPVAPPPDIYRCLSPQSLFSCRPPHYEPATNFGTTLSPSGEVDVSEKPKNDLPVPRGKKWMRKCRRDAFGKGMRRTADLEFIGSKNKTTTVMIKNLPNKFTDEVLLKILDEHCSKENRKLDQTASGLGDGASEFDFLYLPIDFETGSNKGYAFVNFTSATGAWRLHNYLHNYSWKSHGSFKVCQVTCARIQGLAALLKHFRNSIFVCQSDEFLPVYFDPPRSGCHHFEGTRIGKRLPPLNTIDGF